MAASKIKDSKTKYKPVIDEEKCMGCGLCRDSCESHEEKDCMVLKNGVMCILDPEQCLNAQPECDYRCIKLCPNKAISLVKA